MILTSSRLGAIFWLMIHKISCRNFCSFKDESSLSFEVDKKAPHNDAYIETSSGRLSKIEVIVGANASGKTNLMKVLPFLKWILVDSFSSDPNMPIPVQPFAFGSVSKKPTVLSVDFEMDKLVYSYCIELSQERIYQEVLSVKSKTSKRVTKKKLFERMWNEKLGRYEFDSRKYEFPIGVKDLLRSNSSLVASAIRLNHKLSLQITEYWKRLETNVIKIGYTDGEGVLIEALLVYSQDETLKKRVEKILSRFDLGLTALNITSEKDDQGKLSIGASVSHEIKGKKYDLPVGYESSGTKKLISLLRPILKVLASGGIAVLDEIDVNLHPEIVNTIISLFVNKQTNPLNAQFLFSTHSHVVLSRLDKYQIVLTQKNDDGGTVSWRLDENKDIVRSDENIYAKYMSGAYGAVPDIDL